MIYFRGEGGQGSRLALTVCHHGFSSMPPHQTAAPARARRAEAAPPVYIFVYVHAATVFQRELFNPLVAGSRQRRPHRALGCRPTGAPSAGVMRDPLAI